MKRFIPPCSFTSALTLWIHLCSSLAFAQSVDDPEQFEVLSSWSGSSSGVPGNLGALLFSEDGGTLYVVGDAEASSSALYALPVVRDPTTERVVSLGPATLRFSGDPSIPGLDAGLERGPGGVYFYTYWQSHYLGQRRTLTSGTELTFAMDGTGVPTSVAGLAFSPHRSDPATGFGWLHLSSWPGDGIYEVPLEPLPSGFYQPGTARILVRLPQQGTGALQYVRRGPFAGNLMYVNWDFGEVRMLALDRATGLPIDAETGQPTLGTSNPRTIRFAYGMGTGPWGLSFDPLTNDFFVSTWRGQPSNSIIQFGGSGFRNRRPEAEPQSIETEFETPVDIPLVGSDPDFDTLTFRIAEDPRFGRVTLTSSVARYQPGLGFAGVDTFGFVADDGDLSSATATVSIRVRSMGSSPDAGLPSQDAGPSSQDAGAKSVDGGGTPDDGTEENSGDCSCRATSRAASTAPSGALVLLGLALLRSRSRRGRRKTTPVTER